jgi:hypothetical protein
LRRWWRRKKLHWAEQSDSEELVGVVEQLTDPQSRGEQLRGEVGRVAQLRLQGSHGERGQVEKVALLEGSNEVFVCSGLSGWRLSEEGNATDKRWSSGGAAEEEADIGWSREAALDGTPRSVLQLRAELRLKVE